MSLIMNARDAIAANMGACYVTIDGSRYNFANIINLEAKIEKTKSKVPRLGAIMVGHKTCKMEGTFSGKMQYNQSVMRRLLEDYKNTGEDVYFEIQIDNDDPTSAAEYQSVILYDCNTDGGVLAKVDAEGEYLDEDVSGTFEDFSIAEEFTTLEGFEAD